MKSVSYQSGASRNGIAESPPLKDMPYWWEDVLPLNLSSQSLPANVDVAVVGGGYTGLNAALRLARAGRSVAVLDANSAVSGASSRNGGMCGELLKPKFDTLVARFGRPLARRLYSESRDALTVFAAFLQENNIECDFRPTGRITGATSDTQLAGLAAESEILRREVGIEYEILSRSDLDRELTPKPM